jgi:hypothetical protein
MTILLPENAVSIIRGTSKTLSLTVKDAAGNPVDLTGSTLYFTVKRKAKDKYALIQKISTDIAQIEIPNPTDGIAKIYITPEDTTSLATTRYMFDVLIILSSGERYVVVAPSVFEVKDGITVINC